jgi:hypothetical protein
MGRGRTCSVVTGTKCISLALYSYCAILGIVADRDAQPWRIELSKEVDQWLDTLSLKGKAQAVRALDLLAERGTELGMPHSRKLDERLWELRFRCERMNQRITYTVEPQRRIITLTTFRKQRNNERKEVQRARNILRRHRGDSR